MKTASGFYINLYEEYGRDIYVLLNEGNGIPDDAEIIALEAVIEQQLKKSDDLETLQEALETSGLERTMYGVQVFSSHVKSDGMQRI